MFGSRQHMDGIGNKKKKPFKGMQQNIRVGNDMKTCQGMQH